MSIHFSGTFTRSSGISSAIYKQVKLINLKPVKRVQVQFDPFHPNARAARDFLFSITSKQVQKTNVSCLVKTNVVCDRSEPEIKIELLNDPKLIRFLSNNLTTLELLQLFNKHVSSRAKPEEDTDTKLVTKQSKASAAGKRRR